MIKEGSTYDHDLTDAQLLARIKSGDQSAYRAVYLNHYESLLRYLYHLCQSKELAEDLVQDTIITLWERRENLTIDGNLKSYLYTTAKNKFIDQHRRVKHNSAYLEQLRMETIIEIDQDDHTERQARRYRQLQAKIEELPPKRKEIFILSKMERLKYKEIAEYLGISEKTVEVQLRQAMIFLKKAFSTLPGIVLILLWKSGLF